MQTDAGETSIHIYTHWYKSAQPCENEHTHNCTHTCTQPHTHWQIYIYIKYILYIYKHYANVQLWTHNITYEYLYLKYFCHLLYRSAEKIECLVWFSQKYTYKPVIIHLWDQYTHTVIKVALICMNGCAFAYGVANAVSTLYPCTSFCYFRVYTAFT